jgi:hypothetical protein
MDFSSIEDIRPHGFEGFISILESWKSGFGGVPDEPGVYMMILRPEPAFPGFLEESTGGHFKKKNTTVSLSLAICQFAALTLIEPPVKFDL